MPNSMKVSYPGAGDRVPVQGPAGHYTIPYMSGTACYPVGAPPPMTVRTCDPGTTAAGNCGLPANATCVMSAPVGPDIVCYWVANNVPVKNASFTGMLNDAVPNLGGTDFAPTQFTAYTMTAFATLAARTLWNPVFHVRFLTHTLTVPANLLADVGMNVSRRVRLVRVGYHHWASTDGRWNLTVGTTTADISVDLELIPGIVVTQTWRAVSFDPAHGGDFHPQPIAGSPSPLVQVVLRVK